MTKRIMFLGLCCLALMCSSCGGGGGGGSSSSPNTPIVKNPVVPPTVQPELPQVTPVEVAVEGATLVLQGKVAQDQMAIGASDNELVGLITENGEIRFATNKLPGPLDLSEEGSLKAIGYYLVNASGATSARDASVASAVYLKTGVKVQESETPVFSNDTARFVGVYDPVSEELHVLMGRSLVDLNILEGLSGEKDLIAIFQPDSTSFSVPVSSVETYGGISRLLLWGWPGQAAYYLKKDEIASLLAEHNGGVFLRVNAAEFAYVALSGAVQFVGVSKFRNMPCAVPFLKTATDLFLSVGDGLVTGDPSVVTHFSDSFLTSAASDFTACLAKQGVGGVTLKVVENYINKIGTFTWIIDEALLGSFDAATKAVYDEWHAPITCTPVCSTAGDCDDGSPITTDSCSNGGTCAATCDHKIICTPICSSDAGCNKGPAGTVGECSNPGTCSSSCIYRPICTSVCSSDTGCDDRDQLTIDTCSDPGACSAACHNDRCTPACTVDADCEDGNLLTINTCVSPATCDAECSSDLCTPACVADSNCEDDDVLTENWCANPATCDAECKHDRCTPSCTNDEMCGEGMQCAYLGTCEAACVCDIRCTSNADCGADTATALFFCKDAGSCEATCEDCEVGCRGEGDCVQGWSCQNPGQCGSACIPPVCTDTACWQDSDCGINTTTIKYTCEDPGQCGVAECTSCSIACQNDAGCSENQHCVNAGGCMSYCQDSGSECSSDADCPVTDCDNKVWCVNAGGSDSECMRQPIRDTNGACTIQKVRGISVPAEKIVSKPMWNSDGDVWYLHFLPVRFQIEVPGCADTLLCRDRPWYGGFHDIYIYAILKIDGVNVAAQTWGPLHADSSGVLDFTSAPENTTYPQWWLTDQQLQRFRDGVAIMEYSVSDNGLGTIGSDTLSLRP